MLSLRVHLPPTIKKRTCPKKVPEIRGQNFFKFSFIFYLGFFPVVGGRNVDTFIMGSITMWNAKFLIPPHPPCKLWKRLVWLTSDVPCSAWKVYKGVRGDEIKFHFRFFQKKWWQNIQSTNLKNMEKQISKKMVFKTNFENSFPKNVFDKLISSNCLHFCRWRPHAGF